VYDGGSVTTIAIDGDAIDDSKYLVSNNTLTGLYYRLHILNVGVSDLKKYRCQGLVNGVNQYFYIQLDLLGGCCYILIICQVRKQIYTCR
jgi:hypothetical protein